MPRQGGQSQPGPCRARCSLRSIRVSAAHNMTAEFWQMVLAPVRAIQARNWGEQDPEHLSGPPHQQRVAGRIGRRELQQPPGLLRQGIELPPEALLDPA